MDKGLRFCSSKSLCRPERNHSLQRHPSGDRGSIEPGVPQSGPAARVQRSNITSWHGQSSPSLGTSSLISLERLLEATARGKQTLQHAATILEGLAGQTDVRPPNDGDWPIPITGPIQGWEHASGTAAEAAACVFYLNLDGYAVNGGAFEQLGGI